VGQDEVGVIRIHREGAGDDDLARQIAGLLQHIVHAQPVHRQQERVGVARGLTPRASPRVPLRLPCEPLQLLLAGGVAEDHLMSGMRKELSELAAHQPRTENPDAYTSPSMPLNVRSSLAKPAVADFLVR